MKYQVKFILFGEQEETENQLIKNENYSSSPFYKLIQKNNLSDDDALFLGFAYCWEFKPEVFAPFIEHREKVNAYSEFQGHYKSSENRYYPSLHTFLKLFYAADNYFTKYVYFTDINHPFLRKGIISFSQNNIDNKKENKSSSLLSSIPKIADDYIHYLLGGKTPTLDFEPNFPARLIKSNIKFEEVILSKETLENLSPFINLLKLKSDRHLNDQYNAIKGKLKNSQIFVFSGAPGTGKSLTASTLGNYYGVNTYQLDLSRVLSKYVGEFQKKMEDVFYRLEGENAILFIDEADSIFSKRSEEVKNAKDKYANQEMSYLLQRIEKFDGIVILATNVMFPQLYFDKAMNRRINDFIEFEFPLQKERELLWENSLPNGFQFKDGVLEKISREYQVSGASITSLMTNVVIECVCEETTEINEELILKYLKKDIIKRGCRFMVCPDNSPGPMLMEQRLGPNAAHSTRRM